MSTTFCSALPQEAAVAPAQVLGGFQCAGKGGKSRSDARDTVKLANAAPVVETSPEAMLAAADLATDHRLGLWDAVILSAASGGAADCFCPRTFEARLRLGRRDGSQSLRPAEAAGRSDHSQACLGQWVITAYLKNGGTLENAAAMANHASTRTTQLYDRRRDEVSLDEVERVAI